jgi:sterol desaturase/sphingolipid hydroxylase (fatty acid hydroxylase superfamily)
LGEPCPAPFYLIQDRKKERNVMELGDFVAMLAISVTAIMKGGFLMIVANRIVAGLIVPIFEKKQWDKFYVMYVSWAISGLLASLGEINLLASILPTTIWGFLPGRVVGIVITAIVAGGGANLIDDLVDAIAKRGIGKEPT